MDAASIEEDSIWSLVAKGLGCDAMSRVLPTGMLWFAV